MKEKQNPPKSKLTESTAQQVTNSDVSDPPLARLMARYEAISPGMGDRVLKIMDREAELELNKLKLKQHQSRVSALISVALIVSAGVGMFFEVYWPVILVLGLGGMATYVLREVMLWSSKK